MPSTTAAIIDLGTNTFHLLIVNRDENYKYTKLYSQKVPVKIGEGGISDGLISDEAIERALNTVTHFADTITKFDVNVIKATATSGFRNAYNGVAVANLIKEKTGIEIDIIDGHTEASFIHQGVSKALNIGNDSSVIMDIGGGSVEFIICNKDEVFWQRSFEIGGQRLMDKFHKEDPISKTSRESLMNYLSTELVELKQASEQFKPNTLIGSSGTFDTLCEIYHKEQGLDFSLEKKTEYNLPLNSFYQVNEEIISKNRDQRIEIPGMIMMRVDMIVVACCLIEWVIDNLEIKNIRVSTFALKEGVLDSVL